MAFLAAASFMPLGVSPMPGQVTQYVDTIVHNAGMLEREHWIMLSVVVLVVGLICMRGFGSRTNY